MTPAERLASDLAASERPFVPRDQRAGRLSLREIACRRCGRWTRQAPETMRWIHVDDDTLACVDPGTLRPYGE
jgi:hypothetical protein